MSDEAPLPAALLIRLPQIDEVKALLESVIERRSTVQTWYTIEQAWRRKLAGDVEEGSVSFATFKMNRAFQPKGGQEDGWISNKKVWSWETIAEWLLIDDDGMADYLEKYEASCPIPERITIQVKNRKHPAFPRNYT